MYHMANVGEMSRGKLRDFLYSSEAQPYHYLHELSDNKIEMLTRLMTQYYEVESSVIKSL